MNAMRTRKAHKLVRTLIGATMLCFFLVVGGRTADLVYLSNSDSLQTLLNQNAWSQVEEMTRRSLSAHSLNDSSSEISLLRYFHIISCCGLVFEGKLSIKALDSVIRPYVGHRIVMSARKIVPPESREILTGNNMSTVTDSSKIAQSIAKNKDGTCILAFEYVKLSEELDTHKYDGRQGQASGIVEKIDISPSPLHLWIIRLHVRDGKIAVQ